MNATEERQGQTNGSDWQLLGELELPVGVELDGTLHSWLAELFAPLALPEDFLNRFLQSAQAATARALRDEHGSQSGHIHLVIHGPRDREAKQGTWGFFHVGKMVNPAKEASPVVHSIEFYLYMEGQT